MSNIAISDMLE